MRDRFTERCALCLAIKAIVVCLVVGVAMAMASCQAVPA